MKPWKIAGLAMLCTWFSACAPTADTRVLTPAEKEQLVHEQEALELRRRLGLARPRPACAGSTPATRLMARRSQYSGADSFDTRGCPEESMGRMPPQGAPSE